MKKIFRHWKIIYAVCCLVYTGWMLHVADIEFYRINSQYRQLKAQMQPDRMRETALLELRADCQKKSRDSISRETSDCSTWPSRLVVEKIELVEKHHREAKQRGTIKVVLFYAGFVAIFLLAPMILGYLLITAVMLLYQNVKIVRK